MYVCIATTIPWRNCAFHWVVFSSTASLSTDDTTRTECVFGASDSDWHFVASLPSMCGGISDSGVCTVVIRGGFPSLHRQFPPRLALR